MTRSRITLRFVVVLFLVFGFFVFGWSRFQRFWDARHPAVKEHYGELIGISAKRMNCDSDNMKIVAEEPMRARVEGCGQAVTFRWGRVRTKGYLRHWHEIDPNCTVDYMGCNMPCE